MGACAPQEGAVEEDSFLTSGTSCASRERSRNSQQPHPGTAAWALADTPEAGTWSRGVVQSAGLPCKPYCQRAHGVAELSWAARSHTV